MATHQEPSIGDWHIDAEGQLIRVWGLAYDQGQLERVIIQQLCGKRYHIDLFGWYLLDLVCYPMPEVKFNPARDSSSAPHS